MKVRVIPISDIEEDKADVQSRSEGFNSEERSLRYNTASHAHTEIAKVVPETSFVHATPPWSPYDYTSWQPLIAKSQGMKEYHCFAVPPSLYQDLLLLHSSWLRTDDMPESMVDDIVDDWTSTKSGKKLASIFIDEKKWFIRLDQMSPKDSPLGGQLPCSTFPDVISKICSSMRAYGCIKHAQELVERDGSSSGTKMNLILNPWNDAMDATTEFRVFVPPPAARGVPMLWLLLKHGFTFDIALRPDGKVQLIELNPFGAMSVCGACLFNWVIDGRMLYGLDAPEIAVVLEDTQEKLLNSKKA
ncbi:hypothetical protein BDU57DRAFT_489752 [Ampelomyces quisqualis]|uniref:Cell division cycle protein 123 n=1 Tax=Ampelomyces quisqualis TaxID=50730 RepID=A0A6A5R3G5_AMPQU|nr:hypothetical protein BDU57DRAFT_489752 [Ampelomyces quisqualis]